MSSSRHSRREFLQGRAALGAAADALEGAIDRFAGETDQPSLKGDSPLDRRTAGHALMVFERRAMACQFELRLHSSPDENPTEAAMAALDLVERIESMLTVYRPESDLIDLNQRASKGPAHAQAELFDLLALADQIWQATSGAFDPTAGPLSKVWGFSQREGRYPSDQELSAALEHVGWGAVSLDREQQTIAFAKPSLQIDCNSFGKGYALDRVGKLLQAWGLEDSLMHAGRSTLLARGTNRGTAITAGWEVGIGDALRPGKRLATVRLQNEALSSSGGGTQFFEHQGKRYGHLIDPRSGHPAEGVLLATVIAPTAAEADALSTALAVLGEEGTEAFCKARPSLRVLLQLGCPGDAESVRYRWFGPNPPSDLPL